VYGKEEKIENYVFINTGEEERRAGGFRK